MHRRGRVRLRFDRQLVDHSAIFAPYNVVMYAFSAVPARPILDRRLFPELNVLQLHWRTIRDEAIGLFDAGHIRMGKGHNEAGFNSFFKTGWRRFYLKWYNAPPASAKLLCPQTVRFLDTIPNVRAAMFTLLPPGARLNPHRDPLAGSLRYHLGLATPNSPDCRILVDGETHAWGDGEDVVFDETYVHWAENRTSQHRLFVDVERPLRTRWMRAINHYVGVFMGAMTVSPNIESMDGKTGLFNRLFALSRHNRERSRRFKKRNPRLFRALKYIAILVTIWGIFLAPFPFSR